MSWVSCTFTAGALRVKGTYTCVASRTTLYTINYAFGKIMIPSKVTIITVGRGRVVIS